MFTGELEKLSYYNETKNLSESDSVISSYVYTKIRIRFTLTFLKPSEIHFSHSPGWSENISVTVKGVKYLAMPGNYCRIAKNWKDGDIIEINFPKIKIPGY